MANILSIQEKHDNYHQHYETASISLHHFLNQTPTNFQ